MSTKTQLADDLTMLASQLRESTEADDNAPSPWTFDDWLTEYRTWYESKGDKI
jgi:hypothetical protein